jgi:hypothetical protein
MSIEPIPDIGRAEPEDLSSKTLSDGSCRIMRAGAACRCSLSLHEIGSLPADFKFESVATR